MSEDEGTTYLRQGDLDRWERSLRMMKRRQVSIFVFMVVSLSVLTYFSASLSQQKCGQRYANAQYAAQTPIDVAQKQLNSADNDIWVDTQKILTQSATKADYAALKAKIRYRNTLWDRLVAEQKAHPIPPPPDQFC